ncbi:MAG: hypothetical protein AAF889_11815, partial [Cyanobacteria bacterium P01_D01_bin.73]
MPQSINSRQVSAVQGFLASDGKVLSRLEESKDAEEYARFASQLLKDDGVSSRDRYQTALAYLGQSALSESHLSVLCRCLTQVINITLRASHCRVWRVLSDGVAVEAVAALGWRQSTEADDDLQDGSVGVGRGAFSSSLLEGGNVVPNKPKPKDNRFAVEACPEEIGATFRDLLCDAWTIPLPLFDAGAGDDFPLKAPPGALGGTV